ncbi:MAG: class C sortase [Oscillibacter sp.]|nr:class C sortase [Oscillibacter sp.]
MKQRTKKRRTRRVSLSTVILTAVFFLGLGIIAYPTVSDWWNSYHQSRAIASYANVVENTSTKEMEEMLMAARAFNAGILQRENLYVLSDEERERYESLLDLSGTGVMGYIQITSIGVSLPIYHGTEENVLQIAVGHVDWTSLPVGGESTHTVLSGHRGLPSARLFTDLDQLSEGDTFTVTVLNQTITYEVDQIRIVLPAEIEELNIVSGKDYCTLVTCTPYGVNTHRLLVRGHRIENAAGEVVVTPGGLRIPTYIVIPAVGIPLLFLFLLGMLLYYRRKPRRRTEEEILEDLRNSDFE